jgi:DNA primase
MEVIEKVRQVANIVEIASAYTTLRRRGKKYVGLCPFHAENNPSFTVDEEKQLYHCFGCGAGGDVFSLIMEKENLTFPEALRFLAEKYHVALPRPSRLSPDVTKIEGRLYEISELALNRFRSNLRQTAEGATALTYLRQRGLTDRIIDELKLGYALNSWRALVFFLREKGVSKEELLRSGLAVPGQKNNEPYDRFRGRIIFPIFSLSGRVIAFGGRILGEGEPKYLNSSDTPIYTKGQVLYGLHLTKEAVRAKDELILVEGYMDFIALYQSGIKNCAASCGTSLTTQQVALAQRFASRLVISTDGDSAGQAAALRAVSVCLEKGLPSRVAVLPEKTDPDSFVRQRGPEAYLNLIKQAVPGFDFLWENYWSKVKSGSPEAKAQIIRALIKEIEKVPDAIVRSEYLRLISERCGLEEKQIRSLIQEKEEAKRGSEPPSQLLAAEKRLLQIMEESPSVARQVLAAVKPEEVHGLPGEAIFLHLLQKPDQPSQKLAELKGLLTPALYQELARALLERPEAGTKEEAGECLRTLRRYRLEKELNEVQKRIASLEKKGDKNGLITLLIAKQNLTKQIMSLQ